MNGNSSYIYAWSDGQTTSSATNLSAGGYTVTATDPFGCVLTTSDTVLQPEEIIVNILHTPICEAGGISKIEAIDEDTAKELISRSKESLIKLKEEVGKRLKELGVEDELINLKGMTQGMLVILGQKNIKKLSDFADLSTDELVGGFDEVKGKKIRLQGYLEEFSLTRDEADQLIMSARNIVFK